MPRTITLTTEQFKQILKDYLAPPEERKQLSKEELEKVATSLNKKINVPFVSEEKEQRVLVKIVMKVDNYLYDNLPNEVYGLIADTVDGEGLDDNEARQVSNNLAKLANRKIDIPYLPEFAEYIAINFVIRILVDAMRKDSNLNKALDRADSEENPFSQASLFNTSAP